MKFGTTLLSLLLPTTIHLLPFRSPHFIHLSVMALFYAGLQVFLPLWKSILLGDLRLNGIQLHMEVLPLSRVHVARALNRTS
jgi:hypothetical protein